MPPVGFVIWNLSETSPLWKVPSNFQRSHYSNCQRAWCWGRPIASWLLSLELQGPQLSTVGARFSVLLTKSHVGPARASEPHPPPSPEPTQLLPNENVHVACPQRICGGCRRPKADFELSSSWCPWCCLGPLLLRERIGNRFSSLGGCR